MSSWGGGRNWTSYPFEKNMGRLCLIQKVNVFINIGIHKSFTLCPMFIEHIKTCLTILVKPKICRNDINEI